MKIKIPFRGRYVEDLRRWLQDLEKHLEGSTDELAVLVENNETFVEVWLHEDGSMTPHYRMSIKVS